MRDLMRPADGQQHVTGVERAGRAGRAGGRADALRVEQQQQALALDALKAEVHVAGQARASRAVERAVRDLCDAVDELVAQGGDLLRVLIHVGAGLFQGCSHRRDAGDVFCAAALAALLRAALDEVREDDAAAGIEHADALRPVELVGGEAQHVDVHLIDVDLHVARRLDGVGVEQNALFLADRADLPDGLDGADLVVGEHDGHEAGVVADGVGDLLRGDEPVRVHVEQRHLKALLFQALDTIPFSLHNVR